PSSQASSGSRLKSAHCGGAGAVYKLSSPVSMTIGGGPEPAAPALPSLVALPWMTETALSADEPGLQANAKTDTAAAAPRYRTNTWLRAARSEAELWRGESPERVTGRGISPQLGTGCGMSPQ